MLMTMKANVQAARGICHLTAVSLDLASHGRTAEARAAAAERAALLTPIAKAFSTDIGDEAASLGVQVHGGMGFVEETGAAQHMRDSRIAAIYEGANGVQAIDLVQRKLPLAGGETVRKEIAGIRDVARQVDEDRRRGVWRDGRRALGGCERARCARPATCSDGFRATRSRRWPAPAPYLELFGLTLGGACLAKAGLAARGARRARRTAANSARVGLARFFAAKLLPWRRASRAPSPRARRRSRLIEAILADSA